jgi:hypothetical protein
MPNYVVSVAPGAVPIYGGQNAPTSDPAWMASIGTNKFISISGTSGAGGAAAQAYCGFAPNRANSKIMINSAGGHGDSSDNRSVMIDMRQDAPAWSVEFASLGYTANQPYAGTYGDPATRRPSSRHTNYTNLYVPSLDRYMLIGAYYVAGSGYTFPTIDGFDLETGTWDTEGSHGYASQSYAGPDGSGVYPLASSFAGVVVDAQSNVWSNNGLARWDHTAKTWTTPTTGAPSYSPRANWALNTSNNLLFGISYGNGDAADLNAGLVGATLNTTTNVMTEITFTANAARALFISEVVREAGMDYDAVNNVFVIYNGYGSPAGQLFIVTPNETTTWTISIFNPTGGITPPATQNNGIWSRWYYDPTLNCFIGMPLVSADMVAIRLDI